ncbi:MAG: glycine--tRNA ligase [Verrucomicrobia bacterium]|nr:glycine--tRNA ligase [Verrucomicrobiota bacterium]
MAEAKENPLMEKIVSLCKRRGFIYQSSEIYGGINGFWDYGPLGAELKRNVKELWWNIMTRQRDDVVGLEATIIMSPAIWKASGHVDTFSDPMCDCMGCKKRFRADQIEPLSGTAYRYFGAFDFTHGLAIIEDSMAEIMANTPEERHEAREKSIEFSAKQLEKYSQLEEVRELSQSRVPAIRDAATRALMQIESAQRCEDHFSVLLPIGKPPQSANRRALDYFSSRGLKTPRFLNVQNEKLESTTKYCNECGCILTDPRPFNLMFKTYVGPVESNDNVAYLRPETAQAIFAQFKNVLDSSRVKVPFGIAQIGKAFRNEVTPRNYTFRSREFEQMELEFFIKPDEAVEAISGCVASAAEIGNRQSAIGNSDWGWEAWHKYWVEERIKFYESIGLPRATLVEYWQKPEELAHYARATVDILYKFPFSKRDEHGELAGEELEGVAARSDFDLSQHARFSGKPMGVFDDELRAAWGKLDDAKKAELSNRYYEARLKYLTKTGVGPAKAEKEAREDAEGLAKGQYIPHVIEPSAGVDRLILALICNAYHEDQMPDEKGKQETRVVLRFHPRVAPIKVAVLPLLKNKPELVKKAQAVRDLLRPHMNVFYDDGGAIGRRYRRQDEIGTPFCVTIDFDTLGEKPELLDTVTLRYRDDGRQERVTISELLPLLLEKIR